MPAAIIKILNFLNRLDRIDTKVFFRMKNKNP